jgi:hypothetical protein
MRVSRVREIGPMRNTPFPSPQLRAPSVLPVEKYRYPPTSLSPAGAQIPPLAARVSHAPISCG